MTDVLFRNRKYMIAQIFTWTTVVGFFLDKLTGAELIASMGVILALYGAANVAARKVG